MALLTISADDVRVVKRSDLTQLTLPAGEAINAGQYCRPSSAGKFEYGNGTTTGEVGDGFIAEKSVAIGDPLTAHKGPGVVLDLGAALDGLSYGASVYLSDTDGRLADAAGTVSLVVGKVIPGWAGTAKKLLRLTMV